MQEQIRAGSLADYRQQFACWRNGDTDFFVQMSLRGSGGLYILWQDGRAAGWLSFYPNADERLLSYAFTCPDARGQGVLTRLLQYAVQASPVRLRLNITDAAACFGAVQHVCRKLAFTAGERLAIYHGSLDEAYPLWQNYLAQKGNALLAYLQRYGYRACSFAAASREQLLYLLDSSGNGFGNELPLSHFLLDPQRHVNRQLSSMVLKDGLPVAYVLVTSPAADSMVYEQISTSRHTRTSGIILLAFAATLEAGHQAGISRVRYAMYEDDLAANAFRKKVIDQMQLKKRISYLYLHEPCTG